MFPTPHPSSEDVIPTQKIQTRGLQHLAARVPQLGANLEASGELEETIEAPARVAVQAPYSSAGRPAVGPQIPGYELLGELGKGANGSVYKALKRDTGETVAIKILSSADSAEARGRFEREALVLSQLSHPFIVGVKGYGLSSHGPFLAMEYVPGGDLKQYVDEHLHDHGQAPDVSKVVRIFEKIADALVYLHSNGVVHRDLKPANVIFEPHSERPVLADFGLVAEDVETGGAVGGFTQSLSQTGSVRGTPYFMSPEQAFPDAGYGAISAATDVWAFGGSLFYALTGEPPFGVRGMLETFNAIAHSPVRSPIAVNPNVPLELAELCQACLTRPAQQRPAMRDVVAALRRYRHRLTSLPVRTPRRSRSLGMVPVVLATILGLVTGLTIMWVMN